MNVKILDPGSFFYLIMTDYAALIVCSLASVRGLGGRSMTGKAILVSKRFMHAAHFGLLAVADIAGRRSGRRQE